MGGDGDTAAHDSNVFANCPFDDEYFPLLRCLVLEHSLHDFRKALSDISGADIRAHRAQPEEVVRAVRDWFVETVRLRNVPAATVVWYPFVEFTAAFYDRMLTPGSPQTDVDQMPVSEYVDHIRAWVATQN